MENNELEKLIDSFKESKKLMDELVLVIDNYSNNNENIKTAISKIEDYCKEIEKIETAITVIEKNDIENKTKIIQQELDNIKIVQQNIENNQIKLVEGIRRLEESKKEFEKERQSVISFNDKINKLEEKIDLNYKKIHDDVEELKKLKDFLIDFYE